jgi:hypothetical protein
VAVVVATVVGVEPKPEIDGTSSVLAISAAWKADVPSQSVVLSGTTCRYPLEAGRSYLLHLSRDPKMSGGAESYTTAICMGNKPLADADEALSWLRRSGRPAEVLPPGPCP